MVTLGPAILFFIERLSSLWRLKCIAIIEKGPQSVSFIERFFLLCPCSQCPLSEIVFSLEVKIYLGTLSPKYIKGPQSVSFIDIERFFFYCVLHLESQLSEVLLYNGVKWLCSVLCAH